MMLHGVDVAEGVGIVERAVLVEALDVVAPLHVVAERLGGVAAGEELAMAVEVDAPGVAAPLGEQLELPGPGVIAPDALLERDAADVGSDRAPLRPIQPAVRPPGERVGEGV